MSPRPKAPVEATRGLDVDIEPDHFSPSEHTFSKGTLTGLQVCRGLVSHLVRGKVIERSNAFDPAFAGY
jgi:hypothetical protein